MPRKRATPSEDRTKADPAMNASLVSAFVRNHKGTHAPKKVGELVAGLPLDGCLPLQYLFGIDVLPVGHTIALIGKPESLKSLMGWYLLSRVVKDPVTPGIGVHLNVEKKTDPHMIRGIIANDDVYEDSIMDVPLATSTELCVAMSEYADTYRRSVPKSDVPMAFLLDSMGALTSKEALAAMQKTGNASDASGFANARAAAVLTEHFRTWVPENLQALPLLLIYVNHLKYKIGDGGPSFGPPEKTSPGGVHKDYMNVSTIEMIRERGINKAKSEARAKVIMKAFKASFADTGLKISVVMHTHGPDKEKYPVDRMLERWDETEENYQRLHVEFDWDTSLVDILTRDKASTVEKSKLQEVLHITGSGQQLNCKQLGLKSVSQKELGAAIHADLEICKGLQDVLGITRHRRFGQKS